MKFAFKAIGRFLTFVHLLYGPDTHTHTHTHTHSSVRNWTFGRAPLSPPPHRISVLSETQRRLGYGRGGDSRGHCSARNHEAGGMSLRANDHAVISLFFIYLYCAAGNYEAG